MLDPLCVCVRGKEKVPEQKARGTTKDRDLWTLGFKAVPDFCGPVSNFWLLEEKSWGEHGWK